MRAKIGDVLTFPLTAEQQKTYWTGGEMFYDRPSPLPPGRYLVGVSEIGEDPELRLTCVEDARTVSSWMEGGAELMPPGREPVPFIKPGTQPPRV